MKPKTEERIQHISGWVFSVFVMVPYILFNYCGGGSPISLGRGLVTIFLAFLTYGIGRLIGLGIVTILKKRA